MTKNVTKLESKKPRLRLVKTDEHSSKETGAEKSKSANPLVAQLTELADKIDLEIKRIMEE